MLTQFLLDFWWVWGRFFVNFASKLDGRGTKKLWKTLSFFKVFAILANLPTRGHMIDFLVNLAPNLSPKTHQKSTQEAPKINKKRHRKYDASWLGIWNPLGTILGGFWLQVGRQVGAKLAPKCEKWGSQDDVKKRHANLESRPREPGGGGLPIINQSNLPRTKHWALEHSPRAQGPVAD